MSLPTMFLGDWFSVSRKSGTGGDGFGMYTQRVKIAWLCLDLAAKSLSRVISPTLSTSGPS